jgi:hypothetical protein
MHPHDSLSNFIQKDENLFFHKRLFFGYFLFDELFKGELIAILRDVDFSVYRAEVFVLLDFDIFDVENVWILSASSPCESVTYFFK